MIVKRKLIVPGLEEISSDDDTDDEVQFLDESSRKIQDYEMIEVDDSMSDGDDVVIVSVCDNVRKPLNQVWRNIIECDMLDQRIKEIGLNKFRVNRDIESYEIPSYKLKKRRPKYFRNRRRQTRTRPRSRSETILLSSSEDESQSNCDMKSRGTKTDVFNIEEEEITSPVEINDISDSDSEDETTVNTWGKLIQNLDQNQFQIEFASGREAAARKIAAELKETKIDLIDRCLIYLGLEKCQTFLANTKKIEENGGMLTKDGYRRRTPGGVFLTLIKSDRTIDRSIKEQIFLDNDDHNENESLWWKSVECNQHLCKKPRNSSNYTRKKDFNSYTFIDLDYFESIKDFRYRYVPIVSSFPVADESDGELASEADDEMRSSTDSHDYESHLRIDI